MAWSARGSQDGEINSKTFYVRDGGTKTPIDATKGFVMDIASLKTGWQRSEGIAGVAPEWKWNPSPAQMMPAPGDDWKKGISVKVAIGGGKVATWEQAGAATWQAIVKLAPSLQQQPAPNMLPLVRMVGTDAMQFKRGSTIAPVLEVVKWVERPDCLNQNAVAGFAIEPAAPAPAPQPAPQPAPAPVDEDLEF
jgi:hypothetical protein